MKRSPEYLVCFKSLLLLHEMSCKGTMQTDPEANEIRDRMDEPYSKLSQEERDFLEQLSKDLYEVEKL